MSNNFPRKFPQLETERMVLREIRKFDKYAIFRNFSDINVVQYIMPPFLSVTEAEEFIESIDGDYHDSKKIFWGLVLKNENEFIGTVSFESIIDNKIVEIGYDINKKYWGKGYAKEAILTIIEYAKEKFHIEMVEAFTDPKNLNSIKFLEKLSFCYQGLKKNQSHYVLDL